MPSGKDRLMRDKAIDESVPTPTPKISLNLDAKELNRDKIYGSASPEADIDPQSVAGIAKSRLRSALAKSYYKKQLGT